MGCFPLSPRTLVLLSYFPLYSCTSIVALCCILWQEPLDPYISVHHSIYWHDDGSTCTSCGCFSHLDIILGSCSGSTSTSFCISLYTGSLTRPFTNQNLCCSNLASSRQPNSYHMYLWILGRTLSKLVSMELQHSG